MLKYIYDERTEEVLNQIQQQYNRRLDDLTDSERVNSYQPYAIIPEQKLRDIRGDPILNELMNEMARIKALAIPLKVFVNE